MPDAFLTDFGSFLPGEPVDNDHIEDILGRIAGRPSRLKRLVLRNNGILTRHYAIDPATGRYTHSNAQMAAEAVRALAAKARYDLERLETLCAGTSCPDLMQPSHGHMVHGELGSPPCEVFTGAGVCTSSMMALRYAQLSVRTGDRGRAVSVGSEFASRYMRSLNFEPELEARVAELERRPELGFEKEFIRWMLSDGAAAALLSAEPNEHKISLRIDSIDMISYAGELPVCMYSGGQKDESGRVRGWHELEDPLDVVRQGYHAVKQDARILVENVMPVTVGRGLKTVAERRGFSPDEVTWFLPHYSSAFFRPRLHDAMVEIGFEIPYERWFTNLPRVGNAGSASIYLMLEELFDSGRLAPGDRLLCYVPESARFSVAWMALTVV